MKLKFEDKLKIVEEDVLNGSREFSIRALQRLFPDDILVKALIVVSNLYEMDMDAYEVMYNELWDKAVDEFDLSEAYEFLESKTYQKSYNLISTLEERMEALGWRFYDEPFKNVVESEYLSLLETVFDQQKSVSIDDVGFSLDLMRVILNKE